MDYSKKQDPKISNDSIEINYDLKVGLQGERLEVGERRTEVVLNISLNNALCHEGIRHFLSILSNYVNVSSTNPPFALFYLFLFQLPFLCSVTHVTSNLCDIFPGFNEV